MPTFTYTGSSVTGEIVKGTRKAASREAAELALFEQDLRNLSVSEKRSILSAELTAPRVKPVEVMHLTRQLGAFIRAGVPVITAIHAIGEEADNSSVRRMMEDVEHRLRQGETLSDCLAMHPKVFPAFYVGILRSAELTGRLDAVLEQLAGYLERDLEARRKIKSAMIYPAVIAVMSVVTVVVLAAFVLPRFRDFFNSLDAKLPLPTRMLLAVTGFLSTWWWALLAGLAGVVLLVLLALRTPSGRHVRDVLVLRIPVFGPTLQYALVERFCRILASMASAGVPLPEALRVSTEAVRNSVFVRALSVVGERMLRGDRLATPLAETKLFPATASQMIRVGEETGTLDAQLETTAEFYEGELEYKIKKLTSLFEPIVIVVMGGIVGFVAVALVSAMYGIFGQVRT